MSMNFYLKPPYKNINTKGFKNPLFFLKKFNIIVGIKIKSENYIF